MQFHSPAGNTQTDSRERLIPGKIYPGTVISCSPASNTLTVSVDKQDVALTGCVYAAGIFSGLLGFKLTYFPPQGTRVNVMYGTPAYIVGCIPSDKPDNHGAGSRTITGDPLDRNKLANADGGENQRNHTAPNDLLEGEFEITNMLGVALTMLTNLAKLSAGDRASVEVHLLNEMVRVVSTTFRHHSSFGDFEIYNNGRLNVVWNGTSYEHESYGQLGPKDPKIPVEGNLTDFTKIDRVLDTGRWRFSNYLGFLGDFIHFFVTDPTTTLGKLAEDALRSGKAHVHVGNDGSILMQSVTEIVLERVCRIPVPVQVKPDDDPKGIKSEDYEKLEARFLKIWDYGKDPKDMAKTCYQLREYARWFSGYHSLARMHQMEAKGKSYRVPTEGETPEPSWCNEEDDVKKANPGADEKYQQFKDVYSTFRIMRDGSHVNLDGFGNATVTGMNGVHVSSATHLTIEAAGNVSIVAGQDIFVKARRSIEIAAVFGGLKMKARTWWHALCEKGTLWIKSDANAPGMVAASANPDPNFPDAEVYDKAIIIDATLGGAVVQSAKQMILETNGASKDDDDLGASIIIQSLHGDTRVRSGRHIELKATRHLLTKAGMSFVAVCGKALWHVRQQLFDINQSFTIRGTTLNCRTVRAETVNAKTSIRGPKRQAQIDPASSSKLPLRPHFNHIDKMPENDSLDPKPATGDDVKDRVEYEGKANGSSVVSAFPTTSPSWKFENVKLDTLYETLSQQRIRTDKDLGDLYSTWNWSTDGVLKAPRNGTSAPYASKEKQLTHTGGEDLHKPSTKAYKDLGAKPADLVPTAITFRYLKRKS